MPEAFSIPRRVAADSQISPRAKLAFAVLRTLAAEGEPFSWSDVEHALGDRWNPSALDYIRKALVRAGYVRESKCGPNSGLAFVLELVE